MPNLHNIERSGFRRGEYVGYSDGAVYRIRRRPHGWVASRTVDGVDDTGHNFLYARTLADLSKRLAA